MVGVGKNRGVGLSTLFGLPTTQKALLALLEEGSISPPSNFPKAAVHNEIPYGIHYRYGTIMALYDDLDNMKFAAILCFVTPPMLMHDLLMSIAAPSISVVNYGRNGPTTVRSEKTEGIP